jgi:hypothetical protein
LAASTACVSGRVTERTMAKARPRCQQQQDAHLGQQHGALVGGGSDAVVQQLFQHLGGRGHRQVLRVRG